MTTADPSHDVFPVNDLSFEHEVLESALPVLIDVSATWCAPCRAAEPIVQRLAKDGAGALKVVTLDAEEAPEAVARLQVRGFPTFILFQKGEERDRLAGFPGPGRLTAWLHKAIHESDPE